MQNFSRHAVGSAILGAVLFALTIVPSAAEGSVSLGSSFSGYSLSLNQAHMEELVLFITATCLVVAMLSQWTWSDEDTPMPESGRTLYQKVVESPRFLKEGYSAVASRLPQLPVPQAATLGKLWEKAKFGLEAMRLKRTAKSMNHFQVMLGKLSLGLKIDEDETEVKSYLDLRRHMGDSWPFMWTVNNVKGKSDIAVNDVPCQMWSSYAYLDFVRDDRVQEAAIDAARQYATGNHGPRMLGGNTLILRELEQKFAKWLHREDSLVCSAGYLACMSAVAGVARPNDVIFADNRAHASLRAGLKLCGAKVFYFKHNDFADCQKLIAKHLPAALKNNGKGLMVIESVYSMDGDIGDLPAAHKLCKDNNLMLIMDEAHGLGVLGKTGRGAEEHFDMFGACDLIVGTFSKSFSTVGGYITGSKDLIQFLDFHAPGNVFSAPMSAYHAGAALKALEIMQEDQPMLDSLKDKSKYLRKALETGNGLWAKDYPDRLKYEVEGDEDTCVMPVVFPNDPIRVLTIADAMRRKGFAVSAVCAPACPVRRPRFRVTCTTAYTEQDMDAFVKCLVETAMETPCKIPEVMQ